MRTLAYNNYPFVNPNINHGMNPNVADTGRPVASIEVAEIVRIKIKMDKNNVERGIKKYTLMTSYYDADVESPPNFPPTSFGIFGS